ncbi:MAG: proline/glycine betaine ABC transporter permease [Trueperaceae bacterium]|nr:MAG: proline/glycine betaine ABC transporter permease [Trueperaceae bacterium]
MDVVTSLSTWLRGCLSGFGIITREFPEACQIPLKEWTNSGLKSLVRNYGDIFDVVNDQILFLLRKIEGSLLALPWWLVILLIVMVAWHASRSRWLAVGLALSLIIIGMFELWDDTMRTLAIMLIATTITVLIGIPIGILMASSKYIQAAINPILDGMQTMPSFVYLIPVVFFFGLGNVAAIFAIFIYAVPPMIRLTNLGIRLVDAQVVEAAEAFGATSSQILWGVRLPLAMPTLLAGVNQAIMMALAMAVIASMIGARGLGAQVLRGLNNGNVGMGLEAGLAIVVLAVILDRITASYGRRLDYSQTA